MYSLDPPGTSAKRGWRGDIQGLRGIAVLMVVVYHAGLPFPGGFVGVDVFFVISGFVITGMLKNELGAKGADQFPQLLRSEIQAPYPCSRTNGYCDRCCLVGSSVASWPAAGFALHGAWCNVAQRELRDF